MALNFGGYVRVLSKKLRCSRRKKTLFLIDFKENGQKPIIILIANDCRIQTKALILITLVQKHLIVFSFRRLDKVLQQIIRYS